jgi:alpha-N-arabinofuranosidase
MQRLLVHADAPGARIDRRIYGHFSEHLGRCIYEGFWVGEESPVPNTRGIRQDVVAALRQLRVPVLRWPGGCFADEYHWRDGVGPRQARPAMVNTHWGQVVENNHFGTHEFFDLCDQLGAEPYISGNVGSGTVREMQEWVEYITFDGPSPMAALRRQHGRSAPWRLPFFGVGNENWGCGGHMRPEHYADVYRHYQTYVRHLSGNRVQKIACGANGADVHWTEVLMREAGRFMDGLSLHYYVHPEGRAGTRSATDFGAPGWFAVLRRALVLEELLQRHEAIMDRYDPERRVALVVDEWGTWYDPEPGTNPSFLYQQNTLRDALVAAISLNLFHQHAARVRMANIAQTVNVLQAMLLTRGAEMVRTPSYHVFEMYRVHQDTTLLPTELEAGCCAGDPGVPALHASASVDGDGRIHVSICNLDPEQPVDLVCELRGAAPRRVRGRVLTAGSINAHNTFEQPHAVEPAPWESLRLEAPGRVEAALPPRAVAVLSLE